jgi:hypothetical protein
LQLFASTAECVIGENAIIKTIRQGFTQNLI